jgi:flavin-dependent dehydrogenase
MGIAYTDILIAGGGPAGLATAIAAAREGFSVIVADRAFPPIDKSCGEGIMPDGLSMLHQMGVHLGSKFAVPLKGIRFIGEGCEVEANFGFGHGLGIRRTNLHQMLLERASQEGASLKWGVSVGQFTEHSDRLPVSIPCACFGADTAFDAIFAFHLGRRVWKFTGAILDRFT